MKQRERQRLMPAAERDEPKSQDSKLKPVH
jgi:hypothetical protein